MRIDKYLNDKYGYSRTKAAQMISDGFVLLNGKTADKASKEVKDGDEVQVVCEYKFASRGGDKLEKALNDFTFDVKDFICADIGASNGGFTDCLLSRGAKKVFAVDVGECAFDDELKNNPKVVVKDRTNARFVTWQTLGEKCDFCCVDVSFISLKLILPAVFGLLKDGGYCVALIKPQFEAGKKNLTKTGIVNSEKVRNAVVEDIENFAIECGFEALNLTTAPIRQNKNVEYLVLLHKHF